MNVSVETLPASQHRTSPPPSFNHIPAMFWDSPFRIFNAIGTIFSIISLLSTIFVIGTILIRRCIFNDLTNDGGDLGHHHSISDSPQKKRVMNLYQYTIFGLLLSDLLFGIAYMPSQISWLIFVTYEDLSHQSTKAMQIVVTIGGELAESFFIASGLWSLAIALSVWIGIQRVVNRQRMLRLHWRPRSGSLSTSDVIPSPQRSASHPKRHSYNTTTNSTFRNMVPSPLTGSKAAVTTSPLSPLQVKPHHELASSQLASSTNHSSLTTLPARIFNPCHELIRLPKRTRFWVTVLAFGLPLISWVVWSTFNMCLQVYTPRPMWRHIAFIVSDTYHTAVYIAIELATILLRILIYFRVKSLFDQTKAVMWKNTPQVQKMSQEKRKFFRQSILYSLPFLVCGTCLVMARTWIDIEVIIKIAKRGIDGDWSNEEFSTAAMVLLSVHRCIYPLRGFMDSLVYCWMSNWFRSTFKTCRLWSRRSEEREQLLSS